MCTHCWTIQFKKNKNNYTGIQLGSKKPMWIIDSVDINNSVSAYYQRDQEVSHDKIFQIICILNVLSICLIKTQGCIWWLKGTTGFKLLKCFVIEYNCQVIWVKIFVKFQ